jgi:hypothetical protein
MDGRAARGTHRTRHFERDQRADAVAKERDVTVSGRGDCRKDRLHDV